MRDVDASDFLDSPSVSPSRPQSTVGSDTAGSTEQSKISSQKAEESRQKAANLLFTAKPVKSFEKFPSTS